MADVATPAPDGVDKSRPQKPDEAKYKADLAAAEKDHEAAQARFNASRTKIDSARSGRSTPANDRFKVLVEDQKAIRTKQSETKSAKSTQQEKFNRNDSEIKKLIQEQKDARGRIGFKSADEIENKIDQLEKQIESATLRVADERKNVAEISQLRRQKKQFTGLDELQQRIDAKKAENTELKKTFDNAESRALSQKYEDNQKELDEIKAAREGVNRNMDSLKADRDRLYNEQQTTFQAIRKVKDEYYSAKKAFKEYEDQLYQQRRDRQRAEKDAYEKERRKRVAEQKLDEASGPAFFDEIRTAEGLIKHFDPSYAATTESKEPGVFAATAQRTIDDSGFKGMKVVKKEDEDFFVGKGGKKKGKGKKAAPAADGTSADSGKLNMNIGVIEELAKVGVDPPSTQADVAGVVEKLKEKLEGWKKDQDNQTKKNIEKAKADIARLEKEADEAVATPSTTGRVNKAKKVAQKDISANVEIDAEGEREQEKDADADAAKELKEARAENGEADGEGETA